MNLLFACSGEGAGAVIEENIRISAICALIGCVITLALWYDDWRVCFARWPSLVGAVLLGIHPLWTISATGGDCGQTKLAASYIVTAFLFGLLVQRLNSRPRIPKPPAKR